MTTLYKSDPSTGEIFETMEAATPKQKELALEDGWNETPRWHRDPRPHGFDPSNPYERVVPYAYQEFPRVLYKAEGKTKTVKTDGEKDKALKAGWSLTPVLVGDVELVSG